MLTFLQKLYSSLIKIIAFLQSPLLLTIRIYWGYLFFVTGKGKLQTIESVIQYFKELAIPVPHLSAYLAACTECFGGILLIIGLGSRLISIPLSITMVVAYLTAHPNSLKSIETFTKEDPFLYLFASLLILIFGPGFFSIDQVIEKQFLTKKTSSRNKK